jgi:hypothetical protein
MFVVTEGGGGSVVNANRPRADHWERFTLQKVGGSSGQIRSGDTVALLAYSGRHYVVADYTGGREVRADRVALGPWEQFTIHMPDAAPLEALYQAVLGQGIDDSTMPTYADALANGWTLEQVRNAMAHSAEATNALKVLHQEVWGRPIDSDYLDYYIFHLATAGTLADVRVDMAALHLQTVILPVLTAISLILQ